MSSPFQRRILFSLPEAFCDIQKSIAAAGRAYAAPPDATVDRGAEQAMGRWVMGQWVKLVSFWSGHMGHGSVHVDPWPIRYTITLVIDSETYTGPSQ